MFGLKIGVGTSKSVKVWCLGDCCKTVKVSEPPETLPLPPPYCTVYCKLYMAEMAGPAPGASRAGGKGQGGQGWRFWENLSAVSFFLLSFWGEGLVNYNFVDNK